MFDELCRVSRKYVIVSLPNPWADFHHMLRFKDYRPGQALKFYGLPVEEPEDRHKWFFSAEEAERFIHYRAAKNSMRIIQMDFEASADEDSSWARRLATRLARCILYRRDLSLRATRNGRLWVLLQKNLGS